MYRLHHREWFSERVAATFSSLLLVLLLLAPAISWAGFPEQQPSSRAAAMGYSSTALVDGWSVFSNQGAMAMNEGIWVGVHHENRFFSPDLSFSALGASIPLGRGVAGISIKRFGFTEFYQSKGGLAYSLKLAPNLALGAQGNFHHVWASAQYGGTYTFSAEGGVIYLPTEDLALGFHLLNPTRSKLYLEQRIPTILRFGVSYRMGEMLLLTGGVEKGLDTTPMAGAGFEFQPSPRMVVRAGFQSNPSIACFGVGYLLGSLQMDLAFSFHQRLGYTPHFSMSYVFGGSKGKPNAPIEP